MKRFYSFCLNIIEKYYWIFFTLLVFSTAFLCFRCLGVKYIDSWDEARHGISAYEMIRNQNFLINTYQNQPDYWNVKPPLSFWSIVAGFLIFGYNAIGLRFFSALFYLITCISVGLFARRYTKLASLLTMLFLMANYFPFKAHLVRAGDADSLYLMLFTLAMLAMLNISKNQRWLYVCGLCFSLAFLTKSFHAFMIAGIGGLFLLLSKEIRKIRKKTWIFFLSSALLPILIWGFFRYQYDGLTFFQEMYQADIVGRTATGGLEGHGFPLSFYFTSIFWNFDYIYGWLTLIVLFGIFYLWIRPLRKPGKPLPKTDQLGIFLWLFLPLCAFSLVSTKLMWYVYPCIIPLCLAAAVFLAEFLKSPKLPSWISIALSLAILYGSFQFVLENYLDNIRGVHGNILQAFIMEEFDRDSTLAGSVVYLDAYDPFLYSNTKNWGQNNLLLTVLEGDLNCQDGGAEAFLQSKKGSLLIISIPFLVDYPELRSYTILADNGHYFLIQK